MGLADEPTAPPTRDYGECLFAIERTAARIAGDGLTFPWASLSLSTQAYHRRKADLFRLLCIRAYKDKADLDPGEALYEIQGEVAKELGWTMLSAWESEDDARKRYFRRAAKRFAGVCLSDAGLLAADESFPGFRNMERL